MAKTRGTLRDRTSFAAAGESRLQPRSMSAGAISDRAYNNDGG